MVSDTPPDSAPPAGGSLVNKEPTYAPRPSATPSARALNRSRIPSLSAAPHGLRPLRLGSSTSNKTLHNINTSANPPMSETVAGATAGSGRNKLGKTTGSSNLLTHPNPLPPPLSQQNADLRSTQQASTNYKEAFALFDKRGNGRVARDALGDLLRACGQNPTLAEIQDLERGVGGDFDFDAFSKILNRPGGFRDPGEPEEYCRGFQVFDKDMTGYIGVGQLRYILTNLGEKMSDEEVDELLKAVDTSSGEINYTELVRMILAN